MFILVTGGSGCGKSSYAERKILEFGNRKRYYIATMKCADEESRKRVLRHRAMRADKAFETLERPTDLAGLSLQAGSVALLECMSNLVANEYFDGKTHTPAEVAEKILYGIRRIKEQCSCLIVVTNEVFSDGIRYDDLTEQYLQCLGKVNCAMAQDAEQVTEVVCGIPLTLKTSAQTIQKES